MAVLLFVTMWVGYRTGWGWLDATDTWMLSRTFDAAERHPWWVTFWDVLCTVFGPEVLRVLTAGVIVLALRRRNVRAALFLLFAIELSGAVTQSAKWLADRARPDSAMVYAFSSSFPSGHAVTVAAAAVALLWLTAELSPNTRLVAAALAVTVVVVVGFGRVALNVHHPSDVIAGWALGYAYALACLMAFRPTSPWSVSGQQAIYRQRPVPDTELG